MGLPVREEAIPEAEGQGFFERLDHAYETGVALTARRAPIRLAAGPDGQLQDRFLDLVYQPIIDSEGRVGGIFVEGVDVTDHVEAEAALRASETRQRTLIETLPQLVWTCSPDGRCDYLGPQWVSYTGTPDHEHLGLDWLKAIHPDDRDRSSSHWMGAVADRRIPMISNSGSDAATASIAGSRRAECRCATPAARSPTGSAPTPISRKSSRRATFSSAPRRISSVRSPIGRTNATACGGTLATCWSWSAPMACFRPPTPPGSPCWAGRRRGRRPQSSRFCSSRRPAVESGRAGSCVGRAAAEL